MLRITETQPFILHCISNVSVKMRLQSLNIKTKYRSVFFFVFALRFILFIAHTVFGLNDENVDRSSGFNADNRWIEYPLLIMCFYILLKTFN